MSVSESKDADREPDRSDSSEAGCGCSQAPTPCDEAPTAATCCAPPKGESPHAPALEAGWVEGSLHTSIGEIPRVSTSLRPADHLRAWRVRWGIGRMRYAVAPGLYAVGEPNQWSPVLVSANYKLSFDALRRELGGRELWIVVLDTKAVNVWCAAGKGTFGTQELIDRLASTGLTRVVSHRTLVLPQLGAPGVSAHEVKKANGFRVVYGPVRARDLPAFLDAGLKATAAMRRVTFTLAERAAVTPMELTQTIKPAIVAYGVLLGLLFLGSAGGGGGGRVTALTLIAAAPVLAAILAGAALAPLLLPWLPGRTFSAKGAAVGFAASLCVAATIHSWTTPGAIGPWLLAGGSLPMVTGAAAFLAMNFTGASTYTSPSGVKREMRVAVPLQIAAVAVGLALWAVGCFV